ncbi:AI-2E family transporter [Streptomyces sp. NPDC047081]|uniref:AI-2E family transporter n=1 Tax=Streptomyces sp. NPDC047081 TaxID=3154706 RepID=UPI0033E1222C
MNTERDTRPGRKRQERTDTSREDAPEVRATMPPWLPKAIVIALVLTAAFEVTVWAARQLLGLGTVLLISFFLSMVMEPAVSRLQARGMGRPTATLLVFGMTIVAIGAFVAAMVTLLIDQATEVSGQLPELAGSLVDWANRTFHTEITTKGPVFDAARIESYARQAADHVWGLSTTVIGGVFELLTVALFAYYFTVDGPRLRRSALSLLPAQRQAAARRAWQIALAKTGSYVYSRALLALFSTVAHSVAFTVIGIPYAVALGVWVGVVSQFVPTVGTYLAAALPTLVGLTVEPLDGLWVVVFATAYQQVENYLLQPRVTARTVEVHPAVAFASVLGGAALLGAVGAVIAIPAAATVQAFVATYLPRYEISPASESANARADRQDPSGDPRVRGAGG